VAGSHTYNKLRGLCRKRGVLTEENIAWLEQVFRENVGKGKEEFTLDEFKKIVPSKNVSRKAFGKRHNGKQSTYENIKQ
jgi:hypothetical protein